MNDCLFDYTNDFVRRIQFLELINSNNDFVKLKISNSDEVVLRMNQIFCDRITIKGLRGKTGGDKFQYKIPLKNIICYLSKRERFLLLFLVFNYSYSNNSNGLKENVIYELRKISDFLEIAISDFDLLCEFYHHNLPFTDVNNALYFIHPMGNQLIRCKGINVQYSYKRKDEILYMKYFSQYDLFLTKSFYYKRPNNSITENVYIKEITVIDESNYTDFDYQIIFYKDLKNMLRDFAPLQSVYVNKTENTPLIQLDIESGKIIISGPSTPLSPINYFEPICDWLCNFKKFGRNNLEIHLNFDHFNTYTTKFLLRLMNICKELNAKNKVIDVLWYYNLDDDETIEFGTHLQKLLGKQIEFIEIPDSEAVRI